MRPGKAIFIFGLLMVAQFFGFIPVPVAYAVSGPFTDISGVQTGSVPFTSQIYVTHHTGEEWIAVMTAVSQNTGSCLPSPTASVSGTAGAPTSWNLRSVVSKCVNIVGSVFDNMTEWEFAAFCSGSCSGGRVVFDSSPRNAFTGGYGVGIFYGVDPNNPFDPSVSSPNSPCTAKVSGGGTTVACSVITTNTNDELVGFLIGNGGTDGVGFTALWNSAGQGIQDVDFYGEAQTVTSAGSYSISFTVSLGCANSRQCAIIGDALTANPTILTLVIPCNFFQVQCWMYPLLMMSLVGGLMFAAVEPSRPSKEAITYILLASFTFTSAVEVLMGLLPITMPLLLTVIMVVYAWRFR